MQGGRAGEKALERVEASRAEIGDEEEVAEKVTWPLRDGALCKYAREGHVAAVKSLLEQGGNVNERDSSEEGDGATPLICASSDGDPAVVSLLLDWGARVDKAGGVSWLLHGSSSMGVR
jgi:hypothetical protein